MRQPDSPPTPASSSSRPSAPGSDGDVGPDGGVEPAGPGLDVSEIHRRTWEMELLISGGVLLALLQLPDALRASIGMLETHFSYGQQYTAFFAYTYSVMIARVLILAFVLHLATRAYWIGLIGLETVYPNGIDYDALPDGPVTQRTIRDMPTLTQLIWRTNRLSSAIFSFAFLLVFFFVLSTAMAAVVGVLTLLLSQLFFQGGAIQPIFFTLLILASLPPTLAAHLDKSYKRRGMEPPESVRRWLEPFVRTHSRLTQSQFFMPIYYVFVSNLRRKRAYPLLVATFLGIFVYHFAGMIASRTDRSLVHGYEFLPPRPGERMMTARYYDDQRSGPAYRHAHIPSIQSDVVEGPYLRLFLPYAPAEDNETLEANCSHFEPWPWSPKRPRELTDPALVEGAIECLEGLYRLELDGRSIELESPDLYRRPESGAHGLVSYLPTDELEPGRHVLLVEEVDVGRETPHRHFIPFWI